MRGLRKGYWLTIGVYTLGMVIGNRQLFSLWWAAVGITITIIVGEVIQSRWDRTA